MQQATSQQRREYQAKRRADREARKSKSAKRQGLSESQIAYQKNKRMQKDARLDRQIDRQEARRNKRAASKIGAYGIPKKGKRKDGQMSTDGKRRYDAATKTWKIVR